MIRRAAGASSGVPAKLTSMPLVCESAAMKRVVQLADRVGPSRLPVLITGESGVGKERVAERIHGASGRPRLVALNCAALPSSLAEAELFGHARGAYTGAVESRRGLFVEAHGGTLFLDEIGELPPDIQAKLLRTLETGEVRAVGATTTMFVDVRIIAATNRDLRREVSTGRFREDLYHRLAGLVLFVPPLRERREEIPVLVEQFLADAARGRATIPQLSPEAMVFLVERCRWKGNVRELRQAVQRAVVLGGDVLTADDFSMGDAESVLPGASGEETFGEVERNALARAIATHGSVRAAARALGIPRSTAHDRVRALGLVVGEAMRRARAEEGERVSPEIMRGAGRYDVL